jgi:hypothetical protein
MKYLSVTDSMALKEIFGINGRKKRETEDVKGWADS